MPPLDLTNEPLNVAAFYDWKIDTSALDEAEAVIAAQIARKAAVGESTAFDADSWAWSVSPDNVAGWSPAAPSVAPSATPFAAPSAALAKTDETWQLGLPTALPKTSGIFGTDTRTPGAQEFLRKFWHEPEPPPTTAANNVLPPLPPATKSMGAQLQPQPQTITAGNAPMFAPFPPAATTMGAQLPPTTQAVTADNTPMFAPLAPEFMTMGAQLPPQTQATTAGNTPMFPPFPQTFSEYGPPPQWQPQLTTTGNTPMFPPFPPTFSTFGAQPQLQPQATTAGNTLLFPPSPPCPHVPPAFPTMPGVQPQPAMFGARAPPPPPLPPAQQIMLELGPSGAKTRGARHAENRTRRRAEQKGAKAKLAPKNGMSRKPGRPRIYIVDSP